MNPVETIFIGKNTVIDNVILENITTENHTDKEDMPLLINNGTIKSLNGSNVRTNGEIINL